MDKYLPFLSFIAEIVIPMATKIKTNTYNKYTYIKYSLELVVKVKC